MAVADSVAVNLERVLTVFEIVRDRRALRRQLARLAHRHKPGPKVISKGRREDEATRFDADHGVDLLTLKLRSKRVDRVPQPFWMFEQRRDVIKIDAGLRKVRHFSD